MLFKYKLNLVLKRKGSKSLKLFFVIILIALIFGLIFYINESYTKFSTKPEILVSEKFINRHEIPFPAITICPPQVIKSKFMNMTQVKSRMFQGKSPNSKELEILAGTSYACTSNLVLIEYFYSLVKSGTKDYNEDIIQIFKKCSPEIYDVLDVCRTLLGDICDEIFINTLTYRGSCFTFNMMDQNLMFKNETSRDLISTKPVPYSDPKPNWTLEQNYATRSLVKPYRSTDVGSLTVRVKLNKNESENLCPERYRGYSVSFHLPNEYPSFMHTFTNFQVKKHKLISMTARVNKLDDFLKGFPLEQRGCYNEDERQLKYFKQYTMINCIEECVANFTFKMCGCVAYHAPRQKDMRVCRFIDRRCYGSVYNFWPGVYYKTPENIKDNPEFPCNCMPTCSIIEYKEVNDYTLDQEDFENEQFSYGTVTIYFTYAQIVETTKCATYHFHNFIAEVGGFLSLFLGFSLLSILELTFGCITNTRTVIRSISNMISCERIWKKPQSTKSDKIFIVSPLKEQKVTTTIESSNDKERTNELTIEVLES